ncbi:MAG: hypothetical protein HQL65_20505, partial [Magnetococcales bacterium]|nr:hypothetical protein [Magnetococcales bacterium]
GLLPQSLFALAMRLIEESAAEIARSIKMSQRTIHYAIKRMCRISIRYGFMGEHFSNRPTA